MNNIPETEIRLKLQQLHVEHHDLDEVIMRLALDPTVDQLLVRRLKKKKLYLKDLIRRLEGQLIPDGIA
jgi:hypothetical protein